MARYSAIALYELRKDYISRNLCENRDKPELKCCGKCYLKKQLRKVNESHNNTGTASSKSSNQEDLVTYILPFPAYWISSIRERDISVFNPAGQHMSAHDAISGVFRPPPVLS